MSTASRRRHLLRGLLMLALGAWAAFAVEAVAQPLRALLAAPVAGPAVVTAVHAGCDAMPSQHDRAAGDPAGAVPDCCQGGACACVSAPAVLADVQSLGTVLPCTGSPALRVAATGPLHAWPASLLRPPIA